MSFFCPPKHDELFLVEIKYILFLGNRLVLSAQKLIQFYHFLFTAGKKFATVEL